MYEKCKFCTVFKAVQRKQWKENKRFCIISNKLVTQSDGCAKLTLTSYIHCEGWNQQVAVEVCMNNCKTKRYQKCSKCKQGKELTLLFWKLNPPERKPIIKENKQRRPIIKGDDS